MRKNEEGSALVWAIAVVMVLFISVGAGLSISSAYYHRVMRINDERQAYLSAKGVIEDLVDNIAAGNEAYISLFSHLKVSDKTYLSIPLGSSLGSMPANTSYIECLPVAETNGYITISISIVVNNSTYTVNADMKKGRIDGVDKWQLDRYYQGTTSKGSLNNIETAIMNINDMSRIATCWLQPSSDEKKCMATQMQLDTEGYKRFEKQYPGTINLYKSNDKVRDYMYYRNDPAGWPIFDKSEITNKELAKKLKSNTYYIQTFIPDPSLDVFIVYAKDDTDNRLSPGWNSVNLIYNDGHWYYVDSVNYDTFINGNTDTPTKPMAGLTLTVFNSKNNTAANNTPKEKWARFVKMYLTPENILE